MSLVLAVIMIHLKFAIALLIVGEIVRRESKESEKIKLGEKINGQGKLNLALVFVSFVTLFINDSLSLISMFLFVGGISISSIYILVNLFILISKSDKKKSHKIIYILGISALVIFMICSEELSEYFKIGYRELDNPIILEEEFLLYECTDSLHTKEKVYMTITDIKKEKVSKDRPHLVSTLMYFDLRYEGDAPINLTNEGDSDVFVYTEEGSFSDLCKFETRVNSNSEEYETYEVFDIYDDLTSEVIYSDYVKELPKIVNPGETLVNLVHPLAVTGTGYDDIAVEDMQIDIKTYIKNQHEGKKIKENIEYVKSYE